MSDFIPGSLVNTDKYIEVADAHHIMAKQKIQVKIKICEDNRETFIATLHSVLLKPDLYNRLFYIITLMNLGYTCLFQNDYCAVSFRDKDKNLVTLPHSAYRKHAFGGGG